MNSCKSKNFHTESFPNDYFRVHDSVLPMKPQFLLCLLVGSRILYMDHPKDHSLFGLRLPGYEAIELDDIS